LAAARINGHRPGQAPPLRHKIHCTDLPPRITTFDSGTYLIVVATVILQYILERKACLKG